MVQAQARPRPTSRKSGGNSAKIRERNVLDQTRWPIYGDTFGPVPVVKSALAPAPTSTASSSTLATTSAAVPANPAAAPLASATTATASAASPSAASPVDGPTSAHAALSHAIPPVSADGSTAATMVGMPTSIPAAGRATPPTVAPPVAAHAAPTPAAILASTPSTPSPVETTADPRLEPEEKLDRVVWRLCGRLNQSLMARRGELLDAIETSRVILRFELPQRTDKMSWLCASTVKRPARTTREHSCGLDTTLGSVKIACGCSTMGPLSLNGACHRLRNETRSRIAWAWALMCQG